VATLDTNNGSRFLISASVCRHSAKGFDGLQNAAEVQITNKPCTTIDGVQTHRKMPSSLIAMQLDLRL
jgi:hypothetical protein